MRFIRFYSFPYFIILSILLLGGCTDDQQKLTLYSAQKEHLIRPLLDAFTEKTDIQVQLITGDKAALITRLEQEGEHTQADLLLTADIGNIYQAKQKGLLQPIKSATLQDNIPAHLRDSGHEWFGLTMRARMIFAVKDEGIEALNYQDLASGEHQVLIRSSDNVYNQSLMAAMLHHLREEQATEWARGVVANMARAPQGGDSDQLRALAAGEGTLAVANSYYYGRMVDGDAQSQDQHVKDKVVLIFPNQSGLGTHVNVRGGGVTKYAKHSEEAMALLEYLSGEEAQTLFTESNFEYPVHPNVKPSATLKAWGDFKADDTPLEIIGSLQSDAIRIMDAVGWK